MLGVRTGELSTPYPLFIEKCHSAPLLRCSDEPGKLQSRYRSGEEHSAGLDPLLEILIENKY